MLRAGVIVLLLAGAPAPAQTAQCDRLLGRADADLDTILQAGCKPTADQISRAMDNPVGEMVSLPIQYQRKTIEEPFFGTEQVIETVKIIPTFPIRLGDDWSLVNRVVLSFPKVPVDADAVSDFQLNAQDLSASIAGLPIDPSSFAGSTTGFGDLAYVGLITPRKTTPVGNGKLIWALGPTFIFPTASEDFLGQGKYQVGPAGALAYLGEDWVFGLFGQHWWSVAGDANRADVSRSNIQYFISRKLPNQWSLGASPTISVDWKGPGGPEIDLPVGIGLNKTTFIRGVPTRVGVEAHYYVERSSGIAPKWALKFSITPAIPAAFLRNR